MSKKPYHKPELREMSKQQAVERYGQEEIKRLSERALSAQTLSHQ